MPAQKHHCLTTIYTAHVPSGCLCLEEERDGVKLLKRKNQQHCRGAAVACALVRKAQLLLLLHGHIHRCCRQHVQKSHVQPRCRPPKKNIAPSAVSPPHLIVEVAVEKPRSAPGSAALELQGSRAPRAPATFRGFGNSLQATSPLPHSSRNQIVCLYKKNNNTHTRAHVSCECSKAHLPQAAPTTSCRNSPRASSGTSSKETTQQRGRPPSPRLLTGQHCEGSHAFHIRHPCTTNRDQAWW